jgi:hypothetical protein
MIVRPLVPRYRQAPPTRVEELTAFRFGPAIFVGTLAVVALRLAERLVT